MNPSEPTDSGLRKLPRPVPVGGREAYEAEREACMGLDPRKRENYEKYLRATADRQERVDYLPVKLDIENVSRCNFRCQMCQVSEWEKGQRAEDMSFEDYQQLMEEQYGVVEVKIQGMGEPTMGRDVYYQMIRYARERRIWVRTVTNASLLHFNDNYRKLIDSGVNELQISIDGATKDVFEGIRHNSKFEMVVDNCRLINGYCEDQGIERTKMWTVVQRDNQHQLEDLVRLSADMGFKSMVLSLDIGDWGQADWQQVNQQKVVGSIFDSERGERLMDLGDRQGVQVYFWFIDAKYDATSPSTVCPWPFERAYISSDMRIVPCCMIANPEVIDLGDAGKFSSEWNGEQMIEFRSRHLRGDLPTACQSCYVSGGQDGN